MKFQYIVMNDIKVASNEFGYPNSLVRDKSLKPI